MTARADTATTGTGLPRAEKQGVASDVSDTAQQLKKQVSKAQHSVREQAVHMADKRKRQVVQQGRQATQEADRIAHQLRDDGMDSAAKVVRSAAREADHLMGYLDRTPVDRMVSDLGRAARRNPFTYMGAAMALGFFSARLLKGEPEPDEPLDATRRYPSVDGDLSAPSGGLVQ